MAMSLFIHVDILIVIFIYHILRIVSTTLDLSQTFPGNRNERLVFNLKYHFSQKQKMILSLDDNGVNVKCLFCRI